MTEVAQIASELVKEAEARHRENSATYFDALQRIIGICNYSVDAPQLHFEALKMIGRVASGALPKR